MKYFATEAASFFFQVPPLCAICKCRAPFRMQWILGWASRFGSLKETINNIVFVRFRVYLENESERMVRFGRFSIDSIDLVNRKQF